jgi:uncharacterized membrane protein HdeD (DUF308 family)
MTTNDKRARWGDSSSWVIGIALGVAIGVSLGVAMSNIAVGIGFGIAIGIAFALAFSQSKRSQSSQNPDDGNTKP